MAVPTLTANSPAAGSIAWSAFTIQYGGVGYSVPASSTAKRYVYWLFNGGTPSLQAADTLPTLTADDILLFVNKVGIPINVPASTVVDGSLIVDGTIVGDALIANTVHGDRIQAFTITANELAANSVLADKIGANAVIAEKIAADAVTARAIAAGAVTANELDVEVLRAGFTLTGKIQVGSHTWTPAEGLIIPQANGGRIHLPADGVTPARFDGHVNAKSATIENNLNIMGAANKVNGQITLANGITEPTVAPATYASWPSVFDSAIDGSTTPWRIYLGMAPHPSDAGKFATIVNYGKGGIRYIDRTTAAFAGQSTGAAYDAWADQFSIWGGIGYAASHYFVFGQDGNRGGSWYIYKINPTTWAKVAELLISTDPWGYDNANAGLTADGTTVYLANIPKGSTRLNLVRIDTNLTPGSLTVNDLGDLGLSGNVTDVWVGTGDLGAAHLMVGLDETRKTYAYTLSTLARNAQYDFMYAGSAPARGFMYSSGAGKFLSFDKNGNLYTHSSWKTDQAFTASYTWYDGTGTVRETREGPAASFTLPARAHLNIETSTPPDSGNTDAAQVDKANRAGVYVGVGAGARRLQSYLTVDGSGVSQRRLTMDTVSTTGALTPSSNTFVGGTTSTGKIVSGSTTSGQPDLEISGDGSIKAKSATVAGSPVRKSADGSAFMSGPTASVSITFPSGRFSSPPIVTATCTVGGNVALFVNIGSITATGCIAYIYGVGGSWTSGAVSVMWHAEEAG